MDEQTDIAVARGVMTIVFQLFTAAAMVCFLDVFHRHRRSLEVLSAAKAYKAVSDHLTDEQKKELADAIYHRAEEITHYKAW
jgi:hypothetical protein